MIDKNSAEYLIGYADGFKEAEKKVKNDLRREFELANEIRAGGIKNEKRNKVQ
jgi:hypothetical protein